MIAKLQHPAIVPILDAGTWEASGDPFLVMKLLDGKTLAEELAARSTAEARLALVPSLLAIADALGYAHERGIVHRDVKPANNKIGMHGETVLLDWGLAFDTAGDAAPATHVEIAGTPRFMSPEHAAGERPTPAFDVFALGVTLAQVIGEHADRAPDLAAIAAKAQAAAPAAGDRYADGGRRARRRSAQAARRSASSVRAATRARSCADALGPAQQGRRRDRRAWRRSRSASPRRDRRALGPRRARRQRNARRTEAEAREQDLVLAQARARTVALRPDGDRRVARAVPDRCAAPGRGARARRRGRRARRRAPRVAAGRDARRRRVDARRARDRHGVRDRRAVARRRHDRRARAPRRDRSPARQRARARRRRSSRSIGTAAFWRWPPPARTRSPATRRCPSPRARAASTSRATS